MEVWEGGGGGGGVGGEVGAQQQSLAAIGFHGPLFLSLTDFILLLKFLIAFFLLTCGQCLKCIKASLK